VKTQTQETDVAVSGKTNRIVALDLIRGYFLAVIMINHIELYPNGLDFFTGKGRLFVSAAEGFFFMSGLLVGMVYKRRLHLGMKFIFTKMWKRAVQLYVGSVILTLLYAAWALASNHPAIKYGLPEPVNWNWIIKETLLMRFGFGWADFLMRFAILMIFAPIAFWLVARGKGWLVLAASVIAWVLRGQNFTLGWQIIFNSAIVIGFYWQQITGWYKRLELNRKKILKGTVVGVTAISFIYSYASVYLQSLLNDTLSHWPLWIQHFTLRWNVFNDWVWQYAQKWTMGPLRIVLFFCWFAVLFVLVSRYEARINRKTRGVFELLGRNSLYVYIAHSFIVFIWKFFIPPVTNFWENFLFSASALAVLIAVTIVYRLIKENPRPANAAELKSMLAKSKLLLNGNS